MNILPHKSWHVYNKSNIEKVRRDEAKAKEEEDKKLERQQLAASIPFSDGVKETFTTTQDREARLQMLRDRANKRLGADAESKDDHAQSLVPSEPNKHINFWEELEAGGGTSGENPEVQADKKAADDKWERQITMYLDKAAKEPAPWYATNRRLSGDKEDEESKKVPDDPKQKAKYFKKRKREMRDIEREDPLSIVRTSLGGRKSSNTDIRSSHDRSREDDRHKKKEKKHKHTHSNHSDTSSSKSIEQLRAERVNRERTERQRTNALLRGTSEDVDSDRNRHRYNSQFNPTDTEKAHQRYRRN